MGKCTLEQCIFCYKNASLKRHVRNFIQLSTPSSLVKVIKMFLNISLTQKICKSAVPFYYTQNKMENINSQLLRHPPTSVIFTLLIFQFDISHVTCEVECQFIPCPFLFSDNLVLCFRIWTDGQNYAFRYLGFLISLGQFFYLGVLSYRHVYFSKSLFIPPVDE
jgi:hypothetical protein